MKTASTLTLNTAARLHTVAWAAALALGAGLLATPAARAAEAAVGGSLTTRADVNGSISQQRTGNGGDQVVLVGGARTLTLTGQAATHGTLTGAVVQRQQGDARAATEQLLNVGGASGNVLVTQKLSTSGTVSAPVSQLRSNGNGTTANPQELSVGSVQDLNGRNVTTNGSFIGRDGLVQDSDGSAAQRVLVATASGAVGQASLTGLVTAGVTQHSRSPLAGSNSQLLGVGRVEGNGGGTITTNGRVLGGTVTQDAGGGGIGLQQIEVGSVLRTDTATGTLVTDATLDASVSQSAVTASDTLRLGSQVLEVGTIIGGAPQAAQAKATLRGTVTQTQSAAAVQRIQVGRIAGAGGTVQTDASVSGTLSQSVSGTAGSGLQNQLIGIGDTDTTTGTVSTRAVVRGDISQHITPVGNVTQRVEIGSVRNTGALAASTDVTLTGNITQQAGNIGSGSQSVLLGSVSR